MVRKAIQDGVAVTPARDEPGPTKHREVLAHVGHLAADPTAEVAHRELADGERLEDTQALGVREGPTDRGIALAVGVCGHWQVVQHASDGITVCANTQMTEVDSGTASGGQAKNGGEVRQ